MTHIPPIWSDPRLVRDDPPPQEDLLAGGRPGYVRTRLHALDAYRGLIMISLACGGFGLAATARGQLARLPDSQVWQQVAAHFDHVAWRGWGYWDLVQPSFMFMVGAAAAYSLAKREQMGHAAWRILTHMGWRSLVLVLLGIFLISNNAGRTQWSLVNVLSQIGLGYTLLFFCWRRSVFSQFLIAGLVLLGVWAAYFLYPQAGLDLEQGAPEVGVTAEFAQQHLQQIAPPWHKNANVGHAFDVWLWQRVSGFEFNPGGYSTLNFVPSFVTMLFGLMAGQLLRSNRAGWQKLLLLLIFAAVGIAAGWALDWSGLCPLVKRIWTPSWTLFSAGCCCLILALLYLFIDLIRFRYWAIPLTVVGMNSLAVYLMTMLLKPWVARSLETHFGDQVFRLRLKWADDYYRFWFLDNATEAELLLYEPTIRAVLIGFVFWLIALWMYRQRVFIRI